MPLDAFQLGESDVAFDAKLTLFQRALDPRHIYVKESGPVAPRTGSCFRILSWNIGRGYDPERIGATIAAIAPDIACLQEVDWGCARTDGRDVLRVLAERTGMLGLSGIEFIEVNTPSRPRLLAGGGVTGTLCCVACGRVQRSASRCRPRWIGNTGPLMRHCHRVYAGHRGASSA